jgi:hypothetical protein
MLSMLNCSESSRTDGSPDASTGPSRRSTEDPTFAEL